MKGQRIDIRTIFCLSLGSLILSGEESLSAQAITAAASAEFKWHPYGSVINSQSALNPDNYLKLQNLTNRAASSFWFDIYFGNFMQLSGNMELTANNNRSQRLIDTSTGEDYSTLGDLTLGFDQIYLEWTTPNYWYLGYGKYPLRYGYSRVYSPLNYTARALDYRDTLGQWNGWFKGNIGPVNFALNYLPSVRFKSNPNDKNDVERFFSSMETLTDRQTLIVSMSGFFFDSLDTSLYFNMQDKNHYDFQEFYLSMGGGFSWSILDKLIWRSEFLYGNGYDDVKVVQSSGTSIPVLPQQEWIDRNLNQYFAKALTGLTVTIPGDIELSAEYYFNGAGLSASDRRDFIDALKISGDALENASFGEDVKSAYKGFLGAGIDNWKVYELGQHYAFLQIRKLGLFQRLDIINTSILLADDLSFANVTTLTYNFSDNFTAGAEIRFFLFPNDGAYSLTPEAFRCELNAQYSF